ncbi:hypothetical protein [Mycolicibacterium sp. CBMA 234]|uniref:hypothetical protein n=1 Tax=Mycolicibacterium sp. CBMA 234 TaxID=1918495 RepID=UPI0012DC5055|nr:hypothetical protein [Mycolicibacterium sp. CBMA 234]
MSLLGFLTVVFLIAAVVLIALGMFLSGITALCIAALWGTTMRSWAMMPTAVAWGTSDSTGTTIRIDRRIESLTCVSLTAGAIGIGGAGALIACDKVGMHLPFPNDLARIYVGSLIGAFGSFLLTPLVITLRRPGLGSVRLTPDGFAFAEGFTARKGTWAEVTDITNDAPPGANTICPVTVSMRSSEPKVLKNALTFGPEGRVLLAFVQFYWQHPESRAELTNGIALQRLRTVQEADHAANPPR